MVQELCSFDQKTFSSNFLQLRSPLKCGIVFGRDQNFDNNLPWKVNIEIAFLTIEFVYDKSSIVPTKRRFNFLSNHGV